MKENGSWNLTSEESDRTAFGGDKDYFRNASMSRKRVIVSGR